MNNSLSHHILTLQIMIDQRIACYYVCSKNIRSCLKIKLIHDILIGSVDIDYSYCVAAIFPL